MVVNVKVLGGNEQNTLGSKDTENTYNEEENTKQQTKNQRLYTIS